LVEFDETLALRSWRSREWLLVSVGHILTAMVKAEQMGAILRYSLFQLSSGRDAICQCMYSPFTSALEMHTKAVTQLLRLLGIGCVRDIQCCQ
jgi:hypothetical protein